MLMIWLSTDTIVGKLVLSWMIMISQLLWEIITIILVLSELSDKYSNYPLRVTSLCGKAHFVPTCLLLSDRIVQLFDLPLLDSPPIVMLAERLPTLPVFVLCAHSIPTIDWFKMLINEQWLNL